MPTVYDYKNKPYFDVDTDGNLVVVFDYFAVEHVVGVRDALDDIKFLRDRGYTRPGVQWIDQIRRHQIRRQAGASGVRSLDTIVKYFTEAVSFALWRLLRHGYVHPCDLVPHNEETTP